MVKKGLFRVVSFHAWLKRGSLGWLLGWLKRGSLVWLVFMHG